MPTARSVALHRIVTFLFLLLIHLLSEGKIPVYTAFIEAIPPNLGNLQTNHSLRHSMPNDETEKDRLDLVR
jgi:predicted histidine transporter YuiF (NhaC family)